MKKLLSLLGFCRSKKQNAVPNENHAIPGLEPSVSADPEAIEIFINSDGNKFAELYYKNGGYTYTIEEKRFDEFEGQRHYYWCPATYTASFFDTREKAIEDILSTIEQQ